MYNVLLKLCVCNLRNVSNPGCNLFDLDMAIIESSYGAAWRLRTESSEFRCFGISGILVAKISCNLLVCIFVNHGINSCQVHDHWTQY
jgi:hypothetical protein